MQNCYVSLFHCLRIISFFRRQPRSQWVSSNSLHATVPFIAFSQIPVADILYFWTCWTFRGFPGAAIFSIAQIQLPLHNHLPKFLSFLFLWIANYGFVIFNFIYALLRPTFHVCIINVDNTVQVYPWCPWNSISFSSPFRISTSPYHAYISDSYFILKKRSISISQIRSPIPRPFVSACANSSRRICNLLLSILFLLLWHVQLSLCSPRTCPSCWTPMQIWSFQTVINRALLSTSKLSSFSPFRSHNSRFLYIRKLLCFRRLRSAFSVHGPLTIRFYPTPPLFSLLEHYLF